MAAAVIFVLSAGISSRAEAEPPLEQAVKANYLYKFAPFVLWPEEAYAPGNPFTICLIGENGFGRLLDDAVRDQAVGGRPIAIKRIASAAALPPCHILFLGRVAQPAEILRAAAAYPILTVTDHGSGPGAGMINFEMRSGRVRFTIDAAAAQGRGLRISSKLLGLAIGANGR